MSCDRPEATSKQIMSCLYVFRSLVAYLGAAKYLKASHLKIPENRRMMESAHYFYMSVSIYFDNSS